MDRAVSSTTTIQAGSFDLRRPARSRLLYPTRTVGSVHGPTPFNCQRSGRGHCRVNDLCHHACTDEAHRRVAFQAASQRIAYPGERGIMTMSGKVKISNSELEHPREHEQT